MLQTNSYYFVTAEGRPYIIKAVGELTWIEYNLKSKTYLDTVVTAPYAELKDGVLEGLIVIKEISKLTALFRGFDITL